MRVHWNDPADRISPKLRIDCMKRLLQWYQDNRSRVERIISGAFQDDYKQMYAG